MPRTTEGNVKAVLGQDYDADVNPSLKPYLTAANLVVTRLVTAAANSGTPLTAAELESIEGWLAAHFYTKSDPTYSNRSTGGASGGFVRDPKTPEPYKDGAIMQDPSGMLSALLNRQTAGAFWLGRYPRDQTPYIDR
ncbi:MAG: hypothetical protein ACRC7O_04480 [Fimbriiglobus sp.]